MKIHDVKLATRRVIPDINGGLRTTAKKNILFETYMHACRTKFFTKIVFRTLTSSIVLLVYSKCAGALDS
jgi:hypothetical protein